jgi:hypothetical protein
VCLHRQLSSCRGAAGGTAHTRVAASSCARRPTPQPTNQPTNQPPPTELQVHAFLYSKRWETRLAAADTLGALADAFPHHTPADLAAAAGGAADDSGSGSGAKEAATAAAAVAACQQASVLFEGVDLRRVLEQGQPLLASGGQEYDAAPAGGEGEGALDPAERLARQRAAIKRRLGAFLVIGLIWLQRRQG